MINWLLQYDVVSEILHNTVNIFDRFAAAGRTQLHLEDAPLTLVVSWWIASKMDSATPPKIQAVVQLAAEASNLPAVLSPEQVYQKELQILTTLEFRLTVSTSLQWLERLQSVTGTDVKMQLFESYTVELSLQSYSALKFRPSELAASAVTRTRNAHTAT